MFPKCSHVQASYVWIAEIDCEGMRGAQQQTQPGGPKRRKDEGQRVFGVEES